MKNAWVETDAAAMIARGAQQGIGRDFALRIYTSRLLGGERKLVLHGGGNTSLKESGRDRFGEDTVLLRVKASGVDMAGIEAEGFSALRLCQLHRLRALARLDEGEFLAFARGSLVDPMAANPSVETLLHAFLPQRFVDHTHATAVLSLTDQPDGAQKCAELYRGRLGFVPYRMPGFGLAKSAVAVFEQAGPSHGLILSKHGIVTFGEEARQSYERMVEMVSLAEDFIARNRRVVAVSKKPPRPAAATLAQIAPIVRGAASAPEPHVDGAWRRPVAEFRAGAAVLDFLERDDLARLAHSGVITPDHAIRTRIWPLVLPRPAPFVRADYSAAARRAAADFVARYGDYFARNAARAGSAAIALDPLPAVVLVPGLGLFGLGPSKADAVIAADLAETWIEGVADAEAIGRFESISEADMFDCEFWPLEQAKLGPRTATPLAGQIAAVTGAGGAIGAATAKAFAAAGAAVALLDRDLAAARAAAQAIGPDALALACDVTDPAAVTAAFDAVAESFGGLDILVSNAGAAWQGRIGAVDEAVLRASFELNFYGHQRAAQAAVGIMLAQGSGGCLLFNVSKQAVNPGPNFGPYGIAKAALLALMRQYALDYGADGIRANAVNADRIRSGLLTSAMIASRAQARGVSETDYMSGNLLGREVTAEDVAQAFVHQALALKSTADITTVDGGNIAAALR